MEVLVLWGGIYLPQETNRRPCTAQKLQEAGDKYQVSQVLLRCMGFLSFFLRVFCGVRNKIIFPRRPSNLELFFRGPEGGNSGFSVGD